MTNLMGSCLQHASAMRGILLAALAANGCTAPGVDELGDTGKVHCGTDAGTSVDAAMPPPPSVWHPTPGTTWQWQLSGTIDTSFDVAMYDIDLFDAPDAKIATLHAAGRKV